jgi:transcriptional regulator with XRE-family HTH domain
MTENVARRGKVNPENIEEARRLKALFKAGDHGLTQEAFGQKFGIGNQGAVWQFLNGRTAISMNAAKGFASGLRCEIADFSPRLAKEAAEVGSLVQPPEAEDFTTVARARVAFSAGHGAIIYDEARKSSLSFRRDFLRKLGVSENSAVVIDVEGRSMEPTIDDGAVLLVNRAYVQVTDNLIYAFRRDGELFVKRLFRDGEGFRAVSDNPDKSVYPDMLVGPKVPDVEMIGRAMWMGKKL